MKIELFVALYLAYVRHNGTWICVYNQFNGLAAFLIRGEKTTSIISCIRLPEVL